MLQEKLENISNWLTGKTQCNRYRGVQWQKRCPENVSLKEREIFSFKFEIKMLYEIEKF